MALLNNYPFKTNAVMSFDKELEAFRQKWNSQRTNPTTSIGYLEYMRWKYEMLCERINEFNINK